MSARFGSLTFAKRWLVCRAKGNVPNVGRLSTFLSCGWAKKLNLFSVIVISFFHSQTIISVIFGVSVFFFALLLTCLYLQLQPQNLPQSCIIWVDCCNKKWNPIAAIFREGGCFCHLSLLQGSSP